MGIRLPSANEVAFNLSKAKPGQDVFKLGTEKFIAELPMNWRSSLRSIRHFKKLAASFDTAEK